MDVMEPLPAAVLDLLSLAQRESLAYYKKGFRSDWVHPPLSYYIEVFAGPLMRYSRPAVLAAFTVSADRILPAAAKPSQAGRGAGGYFAMGRGWIYPDRQGTNHRLMLNPGEAIYFRFILSQGGAGRRHVAVCSR